MRRLPGDGFEVRPGIDPSTVAELRQLVDRLPLGTGHSYFASNVHLDRSGSRRVDQVLKARLAPQLQPDTGDWEPFLAAVISKGARTGARVEFHQDWTYTDERRERAVIFWMPLVDVDASNGCMLMVPGSHTWTDGLRPSGAPAPPQSAQQRLAARCTPLPMQAGRAVMYDPAIFHGSCPNIGASDRPAVAIAFAPAAARLVHFHLGDGGSLAGAIVDEAFFSVEEFGHRPAGLPGLLPWTDRVCYDTLDLPPVQAAVGSPRSDPRRLDASPGALSSVVPESRHDTLPTGLPPAGGRVRTTLADPTQQDTLDRYGFVVVPAMDERLVSELRALHSARGTAPDDPRVALHFGFHSKDTAYKRAVADGLTPLVGDLVDRVFVDHDVYLAMFITKWPGPNSGFGPHQDPTLVDERRFRGVSIWMPLVDTGEVDGHDNGMLHVVPGSHRFLDAPRTRDVDEVTPFARHEGSILDRHGVGVPTKLGEAIVFDNRIIHYSMPNATTEPRVVVCLGMRPSEASCVMLRSAGGDAVEMFEIDDDSYMDVVASGLYLWDPGSEPVATLTAEVADLSPEEFDRLCEGVGEAPGTVRPTRSRDAAGTRSIDPGLFCAFCGTTAGLREVDRSGLHKAQILCPDCRREVERATAASAADFATADSAVAGARATTTPLAGRTLMLVSTLPDRGEVDERMLDLLQSLTAAGASVAVAMLLDGPGRGMWESRTPLVVVDDLRTWPLATRLQRLAGTRVAGALRGWRLRSWMRAIGHVDAALMHGGFGARVLRSLPTAAPVKCGIWTAGDPSPGTDQDVPCADLDLALVERGAQSPGSVPESRIVRVERINASDATEGLIAGLLGLWAVPAPDLGQPAGFSA